MQSLKQVCIINYCHDYYCHIVLCFAGITEWLYCWCTYFDTTKQNMNHHEIVIDTLILIAESSSFEHSGTIRLHDHNVFLVSAIVLSIIIITV